MPFVTIPWYTSQVISSHSDWLFLFGDNDSRMGRAGQAAVCRKRVNCVGVRTKLRPHMRPDAFFSDSAYAVYAKMILDDLQRPTQHLMNGGWVGVPMASLGTGFADLRDHAPRVFQYLQSQLRAMSRINVPAVVKLPSIRINSEQATEIQKIADAQKIMLIWTVYESPKGFTGFFVAKPAACDDLGLYQECVVAASLESLRSLLPKGLTRMPREESDAASIVETWV